MHVCVSEMLFLQQVVLVQVLFNKFSLIKYEKRRVCPSFIYLQHLNEYHYVLLNSICLTFSPSPVHI